MKNRLKSHNDSVDFEPGSVESPYDTRIWNFQRCSISSCGPFAVICLRLLVGIYIQMKAVPPTVSWRGQAPAYELISLSL